MNSDICNKKDVLYCIVRYDGSFIFHLRDRLMDCESDTVKWEQWRNVFFGDTDITSIRHDTTVSNMNYDIDTIHLSRYNINTITPRNKTGVATKKIG